MKLPALFFIIITIMSNLFAVDATGNHLRTHRDHDKVDKQDSDRTLIISLSRCTDDSHCLDGQRCGETHETLQLRICEDIPLLTAGSVCTADDQCDTGFCINGVCPKECMSDIDCTGTNRCAVVEATATGERAVCVPLSPVGYSCKDNTECESGLCHDEVCKIPLYKECTNNDDCVTGRCDDTCLLPLKQGDTCHEPSDCFSGHCLDEKCVVSCTSNNDCGLGLECLFVENVGSFCLDPVGLSSDTGLTDSTNSKTGSGDGSSLFGSGGGRRGHADLERAVLAREVLGEAANAIRAFRVRAGLVPEEDRIVDERDHARNLREAEGRVKGSSGPASPLRRAGRVC